MILAPQTQTPRRRTTRGERPLACYVACRLKKVESNDTEITDHKDPRVIDLVARLGKTQRHRQLPETYQVLRRDRLYRADSVRAHVAQTADTRETARLSPAERGRSPRSRQMLAASGRCAMPLRFNKSSLINEQEKPPRLLDFSLLRAPGSPALCARRWRGRPNQAHPGTPPRCGPEGCVFQASLPNSLSIICSVTADRP